VLVCYATAGRRSRLSAWEPRSPCNYARAGLIDVSHECLWLVPALWQAAAGLTVWFTDEFRHCWAAMVSAAG